MLVWYDSSNAQTNATRRATTMHDAILIVDSPLIIHSTMIAVILA